MENAGFLSREFVVWVVKYKVASSGLFWVW